MIFAHRDRAEVHQTALKDQLKVSCYLGFNWPPLLPAWSTTAAHHAVLHTGVSRAFSAFLKPGQKTLFHHFLSLNIWKSEAFTNNSGDHTAFSCNNHCLSKIQVPRTEQIPHFRTFFLYFLFLRENKQEFWGPAVFTVRYKPASRL